MTDTEIERRAEAARRLRVALDRERPEAALSDVIYDAHDYKVHEVHDGFEFDGEDDHGYDSDELAAVLLPLLTAADPDAELSVNTEPRRPGQVAVGVLSDLSPVSGFAWVSAEDARSFAFRLLRAAADADDMVNR